MEDSFRAISRLSIEEEKIDLDCRVRLDHSTIDLPELCLQSLGKTPSAEIEFFQTSPSTGGLKVPSSSNQLNAIKPPKIHDTPLATDPTKSDNDWVLHKVDLQTENMPAVTEIQSLQTNRDNGYPSDISQATLWYTPITVPVAEFGSRFQPLLRRRRWTPDLSLLVILDAHSSTMVNASLKAVDDMIDHYESQLGHWSTLHRIQPIYMCMGDMNFSVLSNLMQKGLISGEALQWSHRRGNAPRPTAHIFESVEGSPLVTSVVLEQANQWSDAMQWFLGIARQSQARYCMIMGPSVIPQPTVMMDFMIYLDKHPTCGLSGASLLPPVSSWPLHTFQIVHQQLWTRPIEMCSHRIMKVHHEFFASRLQALNGIPLDIPKQSAPSYLPFDWLLSHGIYYHSQCNWNVNHVPHIKACQAFPAWTPLRSSAALDTIALFHEWGRYFCPNRLPSQQIAAKVSNSMQKPHHHHRSFLQNTILFLQLMLLTLQSCMYFFNISVVASLFLIVRDMYASTNLQSSSMDTNILNSSTPDIIIVLEWGGLIASLLLFALLISVPRHSSTLSNNDNAQKWIRMILALFVTTLSYLMIAGILSADNVVDETKRLVTDFAYTELSKQSTFLETNMAQIILAIGSCLVLYVLIAMLTGTLLLVTFGLIPILVSTPYQYIVSASWSITEIEGESKRMGVTLSWILCNVLVLVLLEPIDFLTFFVFLLSILCFIHLLAAIVTGLFRCRRSRPLAHGTKHRRVSIGYSISSDLKV
jgi:hypothetical protein